MMLPILQNNYKMVAKIMISRWITFHLANVGKIKYNVEWKCQALIKYIYLYISLCQNLGGLCRWEDKNRLVFKSLLFDYMRQSKQGTVWDTTGTEGNLIFSSEFSGAPECNKSKLGVPNSKLMCSKKQSGYTQKSYWVQWGIHLIFWV